MTFKVIFAKDFKKPKRKVTFVVVHCTAADNTGPKFEGVELVKTVDTWHKQRDFAEVGYHYLIDKKGQIITARDVEKIPAAQAGKNTGSIAICCHGLVKDKFTKEQEFALYALCLEINKVYAGKITFHGHCEFAAKDCPVYDYKKWLNLDAKGNMVIELNKENTTCSSDSSPLPFVSSPQARALTQPTLLPSKPPLSTSIPSSKPSSPPSVLSWFSRVLQSFVSSLRKPD